MRNSAMVHRWCAPVLLTGLVVLTAAPARGIVFGDDPANHEAAPDSRLNMVGYLDTAGGTSAALIDEWHVLTAGHAVAGPVSGRTFTLRLPDGDRSFGLAGKSVHPQFDLAVVRLADCTWLAGYELYTGAAEAGREVVLAGFGVSGVGFPEPGAYPRGRGRAGANRIENVFENFLAYDFDPPGGEFGLDEAIPAAGDSGGPTFLSEDGLLRIAGIHVSISDSDADGICPEYNDFGVDVRVSPLAEWIRSQVRQPPRPGDANCDGMVDGADLSQLVANWMRTDRRWSDGDFTGDEIINGLDLSLLAANWLTTPAGQSIPEPATLVLLLAGWSALPRRRR